MANRRGTRMEALAAAIALGSTVREAAKTVGLSERQSYRLSAMPEFRTRVDAIRSAMVETAIVKLTAGMAHAADRLAELRNSSNAFVALGACRATFELRAKLRDDAEIERRLAAIEEKINVQKPNHRPTCPARGAFRENGTH